MTDMIEEYFMERISTHLWVLEDYQMTSKYYEDEKPPHNKINIFACGETLKIAKKYMKMLNKYQKVKRIKDFKWHV